MEAQLPPSTAQEICFTNNGLPPLRYLHKDGYPQSDFASVPLMDDAVVDLSVLSLPSSEAVDQEHAKLRRALSNWGCFQAINHGISSSFLDEVREVTKKFFALPMEEKQKYARTIELMDGYGNDVIVSEDQTIDWLDRIYLTVHPQDEVMPKFWPENPPEFSIITHEYTRKLRAMFEILMKAMARSLNMDEICFLNKHGEVVRMMARFNFYPHCKKPESVLGTKPHADGTTLTVLLQDKEVEGLQVLKDDSWFRVPTIPDAFLINPGDLLEVMSNGILKSPVHRVVTNSERERISVAMFCLPDPEREIGPIDELITVNQPRLYKNVKHYEEIFWEYYQLGERPLSAVKL